MAPVPRVVSQAPATPAPLPLQAPVAAPAAVTPAPAALVAPKAAELPRVAVQPPVAALPPTPVPGVPAPVAAVPAPLEPVPNIVQVHTPPAPTIVRSTEPGAAANDPAAITPLTTALAALVNKVAPGVPTALPRISLDVELQTPAIELPEALKTAQQLDVKVERERAQLEPLKPSIREHVPSGGLRSQINNSDNSRNLRIDRLEVKTTLPVNGRSLMDELRMVGG